MNVLHVIASRDTSFGGPVRVAENIAEFLLLNGDEVRIFPEVGECTKGRWYVPSLVAIRRLSECVKWSDVVHIHGMWTFPTTYAAYIARKTNTPYIINPHGMLDRWQLKQRKEVKQIYSALIEKRSLNKAGAVCFTHLEELEEARDYMSFSNAFILPNPVNIDTFKSLPSREALDELYPQGCGKIVIFFMARIHYKKGLDLLIQALGELLPALESKFHLLVAGEDQGGHLLDVKKMVTDLKLEKQVTFVGEVLGDQKNIFMGGSDIFALTSRQEGDSIAIKEAMAAGLPLLISRQCHYPEWQKEGIARVVDTEVRDIADALNLMISDSSHLKSMGLLAKVYAKENFSSHVVYQNLRSGYQDLIHHTRNTSCWIDS